MTCPCFGYARRWDVMVMAHEMDPPRYARWRRLLYRVVGEPHRVYRCPMCGHYIGIEWSGSHVMDDCPWLGTEDAKAFKAKVGL